MLREGIFEQVYRFLDKQLDSDVDTIQREFTRHALIYVPDTPQHYQSAVDVLRKDGSEVCGDAFGYLKRHHPRLRSFFVELLKVREHLSPRDYAAFLERLSPKAAVAETDEKRILMVYEELSRGLDPEANNNVISEEMWWPSLIKKQIFWTHKDEFWLNESPSRFLASCIALHLRANSSAV